MANVDPLNSGRQAIPPFLRHYPEITWGAVLGIRVYATKANGPARRRGNALKDYGQLAAGTEMVF